ncbi:MAG: hypothetical protein ACON5B_04555 [Myxococcota bacterium]
MTWTLVEPCCGTGALTLAALGATRPLMPHPHSQWPSTSHLLDLAREHGFHGPPSAVHVTDIGPWGSVLPVLLRPETRRDVLTCLKTFLAREPRALFDALQRRPVASQPSIAAAEFLTLQRLTTGHEAVAIRRGTWHSPSFSPEKAYGVRSPPRSVAATPRLPDLIAALETWDRLHPTVVHGERGTAPEPRPVSGSTLVAIDPPARTSEAYMAGHLMRGSVVELALGWDDAGATVFVTETEPIDDLVERGWRGVQLPDTGQRTVDGMPIDAWVTISPRW